MACCTFVAFIVSQLYLMLRAAAHWLGRKPSQEMPLAVMWRLEPVVPAAPPELANQSSVRSLQRQSSRFGTRAWLGAALAIELALVVAGAQWFGFGAGRQALTDELGRLAQIESFADFKDFCRFEFQR
jgi:hypothetical protein